MRLTQPGDAARTHPAAAGRPLRGAPVLRQERLGRVVVARVPEHEAHAAAVGRPLDLGPDLARAEDAPVERIVAEVLEPRPHLHRGVLGALADQAHALADDLVGVHHGVAEAGNAEVIAGRVDHGTDVVEVRRQLFHALADVGVVGVEGRIAEDVRAQERPGRAQLAARLGQERRRWRAGGWPTYSAARRRRRRAGHRWGSARSRTAPRRSPWRRLPSRWR